MLSQRRRTRPRVRSPTQVIRQQKVTAEMWPVIFRKLHNRTVRCDRVIRPRDCEARGGRPMLDEARRSRR